MNILFLNHNIAWTGGFFRAFHWGRHLANMGHSVSIVTISENNRFRFSESTKEKVQIIKSPDLFSGKYRTGWDLYDTLSRIVYLRNKKFDIIHCVDSRPNVIIPALFLRRRNHCKLIMDWGDWWGKGGTIQERSNSILEKLFEPIETFFEEYFRKYADGHVVLSKALHLRCINLQLNKPIIKIPHGADTSKIEIKDKIIARTTLGFHSNAKLIGYLGTIFPNDAELLISAYRIVLKSLPNIKLLIIGNCKIGFPEDLILNTSIIKTGKLDFSVMTDYIAVCDFMLLPLKNTIANNGRFPSKVSDYLAAGKPVISTNVGDIPDLLINSKAGVLSSDNPASFAKAIIDAFSILNTEECGKVARTIAERELSWNILTKNLESFYKQITN